MYLSKVMIGGAACRNPYEVHRALWQLFPADADAKRDYLFRVERSSQQQAEVLVQSLREPSREEERGVRLLDSRNYLLALKNGMRLRFMLIANPIKTINDENGRLNAKRLIKKCRVPLIRDEEWRNWLEKKFKGGAELESLITEKRMPLNFRKTKEKRVGKIQPVSFQGVLQVSDSDVLRQLVVSGIGPAKSFGCGLLSLARA